MRSRRLFRGDAVFRRVAAVGLLAAAGIATVVLVPRSNEGTEQAEPVLSSDVGDPVQVEEEPATAEAQGDDGSYIATLAATDRTIALLQARVDDAPTDWVRAEPLVAAILNRARLTGDYADYQSAEAVLDTAFAAAVPGSGPVTSRMRVNFVLHRFDAVRSDLHQLRERPLTTPAVRASIDSMAAALLLVDGDAIAATAAMDAIAERDQGGPSVAAAAIAHWKIGEFDEADALLARASAAYHGESSITPAWIELHRGLIDFERGRVAEALQHYEAADAALPGWWLIEEHIAEALADSGAIDEAVRLYREIVRRCGHPEFMDALAEIDLARGENESSLAWASRAEEEHLRRMALYPEAGTGHAAEHWLTFGEPLQALELASQNAQNSPNGGAMTVLINANLRAERFAAAAAAADRALAGGYSSADLHSAAGSAYHSVGRSSDAETQFSVASSIDPRLREF